MFLVLFLFWTNGIQYNRVFLASSSLTIIILSLCISIKKNLFFLYLSKIFYFLSILTCIILTFYHLDTSIRSNPYGFKMLFVDKYTLEDRTIKSFERSEWDNFISNDPKLFLSIERKNKRKYSQKILNESFDYEDIKKINEILYKNDIDIIIHNFKKFHHLHIVPHCILDLSHRFHHLKNFFVYNHSLIYSKYHLKILQKVYT